MGYGIFWDVVEKSHCEPRISMDKQEKIFERKFKMINETRIFCTVSWVIGYIPCAWLICTNKYRNLMFYKKEFINLLQQFYFYGKRGFFNRQNLNRFLHSIFTPFHPFPSNLEPLLVQARSKNQTTMENNAIIPKEEKSEGNHPQEGVQSTEEVHTTTIPHVTSVTPAVISQIEKLTIPTRYLISFVSNGFQ